MAHAMTTKELSRYLKLHVITICKYASRGEIPGIKIGREWRFDKDVIDAWIGGEQNKPPFEEQPVIKRSRKPTVKHKLRKRG